MVELQIVVLAVAGSSPVGHPRALRARNPKAQIPGSKVAMPPVGFWCLGFGISAAGGGTSAAKEVEMLNPAVIESHTTRSGAENFWSRILTDEELGDCDNLQKLLVGCEIIAALDAVDLLAA